MIIDELMCQFSSGIYDERLMDIYVDDNKLNYQKQRYVSALRNYMEEFGSDDVEIYSAPGRSEVGGNHTDHQNGEILAASINLDAMEKMFKWTSKAHNLRFVSLRYFNACGAHPNGYQTV